MATKVGEGYIEIRPKLVGFSRDLLREARARIREVEAASKEALASVSVRPKVVGVNREFQREVQRELTAKITGLTVPVKVKLDKSGIQATFQGITITARNAGERAGDNLSSGFRRYIGGVHEDINKVNIALKSGFKAPDDSGIRETVDALKTEFRELAEQIDTFSRDEVRAINRAINAHKALNNTLDRETNAATKEFERSFRRVMQSVDSAVENIKRNQVSSNGAGVFKLAQELDREIRDANKIADALFPELEQRIAHHGSKGGSSFGGAFMRALRSNFFDNASEGLLNLAANLAVTAAAAGPLISSLSNLSAGMVNLGAIAVDLYGAFLSLPAVWGAVAQASIVLTVAFAGIQDALTALANEEEHAAANAEVRARQIASAQNQVADAKERLARAIESANDRIEAAEEAVAQAQIAAARRVADAQERVIEAQEAAVEAATRAAKRVADAQKDLSRAYESAAQRIASAEARHADAIKRVREAQEDLNQAYADALERFEDLNIALGNAILDEEGAKIAIERAKQRLDETLADPNATDLDRREADLAYRQAIQRLQEIEERQQDLRKEVEEANKSGVEGSREVQSAKERLQDAYRAEIEAQQAIAQAHEDAAQQIADAQDRLAEAQADAVKAQVDGAKRVQEAEQAVAEAREAGAKSIEEAQKRLADAHKDAARSIADAQKDVARSIENLTEVQNRQNEQFYNARYAMSQLSPEAQKFVTFLDETFIPKLKQVQVSIQDAFFPPIQRALEDSEGLLVLFQEKLTNTSSIFGHLIGQTIEWLETPEVRNQLGRILDSNNRLFVLLGEAGKNFGDVLLDVAEASGPFLERMAKLVLDFSKWLADITNSEDGRRELKEFFENVGDTIETVWGIIKEVGGALYEVYQLARPYGQDLLKDIEGIAKEFSAWVNSKEGRADLEKFLRNGRDFLREMFKLAEDVAKAFFEMGRDQNMANLIKSLREDLLPAILRLINALGGEEGNTFIFLIKAMSLGLNAAAANVQFLAGVISAFVGVITGDFSTAREHFANFLDIVRSNAKIVFEEQLPDNFDTAFDSFLEGVRGAEQGRESLSNGLGQLGQDTDAWRGKTEEGANRVRGTYEGLASGVNDSMGRYRGSVDSETEKAKEAARKNADLTAEIIVTQIEKARKEAAAKMGDYKSDVDNKTREAKDASNRNLTSLIGDTRRILNPFSQIFEDAAREAQRKMQDPGASWWDIGRTIIDSLMRGVRDLIPNLITQIWNLGIDIVNTIRQALDSHSPSRKLVAAGRDAGEGLALGIESMAARVKRATQTLARSVVDTFGTPSLEVEVGSVGRKAVTGIQPTDTAVAAGARNVHYITVNAAPTIPTEKQIANVLRYQDALYN